uniref:TAFH domain-containing protein n=1 Tax=Electrophorus electricus TaxID=8005 RepID=A0A4W4DXM1_ELEEL
MTSEPFPQCIVTRTRTRPLMAGASDPLEEMLFSEVDEKAVSDLVGSLESQLGGPNSAAGAHGESRGGAHTAKQHPGRALPARVGTPSEDQPQQGQHAAARSQDAKPARISPDTRAKPPSLGSAASLEEGSTSETGASASGVQSHGPSASSGVSDGVTSPPVSIHAGNKGATPGSGETSGACDTRPKHLSPTARSTPVFSSATATTCANATTFTVRNGTAVSALVQQAARTGETSPAPQVNHARNCDGAEAKSGAPSASKVVVPGQPGTVNSAINTACSPPVVSPSAAVTSAPTAVKPTAAAGAQTPTTAGMLRPAPPATTPLASTTPAQTRAGLAPPPRIVAPQLIVRPPQQQTTIQLPPGFTIPPGMVLVRTELGQLVLVPQQALAQAQAQSSLSPRPTTPTGGAAFRVATPQVPAVAVTAPQQVPATLGPQGPHGQPTLAPPSTFSLSLSLSLSHTHTLMALLPLPQEMQENVKKCKNFLATLIKLASHNSPSPETSRNVKALVQDLLDAKIEPEEFTNRLQSELKSSPQPYLVPFLKKSLPALRLSLLNSQQSLVQPPQAAKTSVSPAGAVAGTVTPGNATRQPNKSVLLSSSPRHAWGCVGLCTVTCLLCTGAVGKAPTIQTGRSPTAIGVQLSGTQKNKLNDPGGGSFRDDDDINDVASMAGVNLNEESARILATNSELVGTQIRSCKDEAFLPTGLLHRRVLEMARKFGVTEVPLETVNYISHATQARLRTVLEKVSSIAQHRMDSGKDEDWCEQTSDVRSQLKFFEQLERLEKQRKDEQEREILLRAAKSRSRLEDPEQARLKQKAKEMQQQELAQMRQRDANLTALAAIGPRKKRKLDSPGATATGPEVSCGSAGSPASSSVLSASSRQYPRLRITRVNLRDFIFYLEQERETSRSLLLYRALLK